MGVIRQGILLLFAATLAAGQQGKAAGAYRYTYIAQSASLDQVTLYAVTPEDAAHVEPLYTFALPGATFPISAAYPSPDGRWAAITLTTRAKSPLLLLDVETGGLRELGDFGDWTGFQGLEQPKQVVWSPDSRWIAIRDYDYWLAASDVVLYSLLEGESKVLASPSTNNVHLSWSADSRHLAVTGFDALTCCTYRSQIVVFDVEKRSQTASFDLSIILGGATPPDSELPYRRIGYLNWSPQGTYLSFVIKSGTPNFERREVYVVNMRQEQFTRLAQFETHVGPAASGQPDKDKGFERIIPFWASEQALLVSRWLERNAGERTITQDVLAYAPGTGTLKAVASDFVQEWAPNPVTGEIAYRLREVDEDGNPVAEVVQIATFDGVALRPKITAPAGCDNLVWSPDGATLVYRNASQYCWEQPFITFVDSASGRITQHQMMWAEGERVTWLGWLRVN